MSGFLVLLPLLLGLATASAAEISVLGSLVHEHQLQDGQSTEGTILVRNNDAVARDVVVRQADYRFDADGHNEFSEPGTLPRSNGAWIRARPHQVHLQPEQTAVIHYTLDVPVDDELSGTYWSLVLVEALPVAGGDGQDEAAGRGVQIRTVVRYGVQIITELGGPVSDSLAFDDVELVRDETGTSLVLDVSNPGTRQLRPRLWLDLFDSTGASAGRVEATARTRLFPGCSTRVVLDLTHLPPDEYAALVIADAGTDQVFGAEYTLDLRP